jgi:uncharacterized DUF497 family protein
MTIESVSGFDWDDGNRAKCTKHGVSLAEIEGLFRAEPSVYADADHSLAEQRLGAIGRTPEGRAVLVAFTLREIDGETLIRPISARYMHAKELRRYEQG